MPRRARRGARRPVRAGRDRLAGPGVVRSLLERAPVPAPARPVVLEGQHRDGRQRGRRDHDDEQDPVDGRIARSDARGAADDRRDGAPEERRPDVRDVRDGELEREQLAAVLGPAALHEERRLDDEEGLVRGPHRRREEEDRGRLGREEEAGDRERRAAGAERQHEAPAVAVGEDARREGGQHAGGRAGRSRDPDEGRVEPERRQVQVEVDPPEAERDAVDEGREEEDPGVALEAGEAADVAPERAHPALAGARVAPSRGRRGSGVAGAGAPDRRAGSRGDRSVAARG